MASTKSFTTSNSYATRKITVNLYQKSIDYVARTSRIAGSITITGTGSSSSSIYISTGATTITVGGKQIYYCPRTDWSAKSGIVAQGTITFGESSSDIFTVSHDDTGACTVACSIATAFYTTTITTTNGGNWSLDSCGAKVVVPTVGTPTISSITETTAAAKFSVTSNGGGTVSSPVINIYSSSSSTTVLKTISAYSGSYSSLSPGTTYYARAQVTNSAGIGYSSRVAFTMISYPYITAVSTSNLIADDYTQKVTIYNPLGRSVAMTMYDTTNSSNVKTGTITGTSWSFTVSTTDMAAAMGSTKTSSSCGYKSVYGTTSTKTGYTYSLNTSTIKPTWSAASSAIQYVDTNTAVTAITGSSTILVQGKSSPKISLSSATAAGQYGATISQYQIGFNSTSSYNSLGSTGTGTYTVSASNFTSASNKVYSRVLDSRGQYSSVGSKTLTTLSYFNPSLSIAVERIGGYSQELGITTNISWAVGSGNVGTIVYNYRKTSGSWLSSWISETALKAVSYEEESSYDIAARATDKFGGITTVYAVLKVAEFPFFIDTEQQAIGINCFPTGKGIYTPDLIQTTGNMECANLTASATVGCKDLTASGSATITGSVKHEGGYTLPIIIVQDSEPSGTPSNRNVIWIDTSS